MPDNPARSAPPPVAAAGPGRHSSTMLRVCEIFRSVQGEGSLSGTDSVFLRTSGCNLRCGWCDTPYASFEPEGPARDWAAVCEEVGGHGVHHVVVTGGEPLLPRDISPLSRQLSEGGHHLTFETAGTVLRDVACDLVSISPKRANSTPSVREVGERWVRRHESDRDRPEVVRELLKRHAGQLKFVCRTPADVEDAASYVDRLRPPDGVRVYLMPEGRDAETLRDRETWLRPAAEAAGFEFGPRLHVELFGDTRGT